MFLGILSYFYINEMHTLFFLKTCLKLAGPVPALFKLVLFFRGESSSCTAVDSLPALALHTRKTVPVYLH